MKAPTMLKKRIRELTSKHLEKDISPQEKTELENILADKRRQLCVTREQLLHHAKRKKCFGLC